MHKLFTLGYTTTRPEELREIVFKNNAYLVDIRFNPYSPFSGWRKENLRSLVGEDRYVWVKEFGNINYRNGGPIELLEPEEGVINIATGLKKKNVILLCGCKELETCHRKVAAELLESQLNCEVEHLMGSKLKK